jgi:hypothetical protein
MKNVNGIVMTVNGTINPKLGVCNLASVERLNFATADGAVRQLAESL